MNAINAITADDAETQAQNGWLDFALDKVIEADRLLNEAQLAARGGLWAEIDQVRLDLAGARGRLGTLRYLVNRARRDGGDL